MILKRRPVTVLSGSLSAGKTTPSRRVFTVPTGAQIVLRGTNWPEYPASGLMNRSPDGTDETRLMLVIDPIFDLEDAA